MLVYNHAEAPTAVVDQATKVAGAIYRPGGTILRWIRCGAPPGGEPDPCRYPLGPAELVVRITRPARSSPWKVSASALGVAVVATGEAGYYCSVFYDRVRQLSESRQLPTAMILGHAIAHEVGHLLLKSPAHSLWGLMRRVWDREDERLAACGRLRLLPEEAAQIRAEASSRMQQGLDAIAGLNVIRPLPQGRPL